MEDLSEQAIKKNCPHCNPASHAFRYFLEETPHFYIVCDAHPLVAGHILIIPKQHLSCVAVYPDELYRKFLELDSKVSKFLQKEYGAVSSFEHGVFGQTVFHSHVHYLPFAGKPTDIVPEGEEKLSAMSDLGDLKTRFRKDGGYLYFSIGKKRWTVDAGLAAPRFFRDRFARALGRPERGNWKRMETDAKMMQVTQTDNLNTQEKWKK